MKVLLLTDRFSRGGVTNVLTDLARSLEHEYAVRLGAMFPSQLDNELRDAFPSVAIGMRAVWLAAVDSDLINSHQRAPATFIRAIAPRRPTVEHVHNEFSNRRLISFRSDAIVAVSSRIADHLNRHYTHLKDRPIVILNGIPDPGRGTQPLTDKSLSIVGAGRLTEQKDPLRFLDLIASMRHIDPTVTGTWVGSGELRSAFLDRVSALGLHECVSLVEWEERNALIERVRRSSALAISSAWEGLPLVALESFAAATPVLTTDCGDLSTFVRDSEAGRVWENGESSDVFARRALDYLSHSALLHSSAARELYDREFTVERMAREVGNVYNKLLN